MLNFSNRASGFGAYFSTSLLNKVLTAEERERLERIINAWNFYEGYHWEDLSDIDAPQLTVNYCRAFVDKFVAFELGKAFSIRTKSILDEINVSYGEERTMINYLQSVWDDNDQLVFITELGQEKSITGDAWVQVLFYSSDELDDIYQEYPQGRIRILLHSTATVFPTYDSHRKDELIRVVVMYEYEEDYRTPILGRQGIRKKLFRQEWTKDRIITKDGDEETEEENSYGIIPFVQIKNYVIAGRNEGRGDLDDIIPLNVELNLKTSNVSDIIDYHAAPTTIVQGAKIGNLEKGANKMWGGLAKDAKVYNLELNGDLGASTGYITMLKNSMCEIGGIPETTLGGAKAISNTSGVALQYINLPLIERTRVKKMSTSDGLENINKLIILISMREGLIRSFEEIGVSAIDYYWTEVTIPDTLPKDMLLELQQIQTEMQFGMESREGGMARLGKENIQELITRIDADREANPQLYGIQPMQQPQLNSGMTNGQTPVEQVRREITGQNGGGDII